MALTTRKEPPPEVPHELAEAIEQARETQLLAHRYAHRAAQQWRDVARRLADEGFSLADTAAVLGVSPSRVRTLVED